MASTSSTYEFLQLAIKRNSVQLARRVLRKCEAQDTTWNDYNLLINALHKGRKEIARLLVLNGCRVYTEKKTNIFYTPLYYAVKMEDFNLTITLLDKGALINDRDRNKDTVLNMAMKNIRKYHTFISLLVFKYSEQVKSMNLNNKDDLLAFSIACRYNRGELVTKFIELGVSPDSFIYDQNTETCYYILHKAVENESTSVVKVLLQHGANLYIKDKTGLTPLHWIFYNKKKLSESDKIILEDIFRHIQGNVNPTDANQLSIFHLACLWNEPNTIERFLTYEVDVNKAVDINSPVFPGYTALHFCVLSKNRRIIELLLDHGVDTTVTDANKLTALHLAYSNCNPNSGITDLILSCIPKTMNPKPPNNLSHLQIAIASGNLQTVTQFLDNTSAWAEDIVDVESPYFAGYTCLHIAVELDYLPIIELLLLRCPHLIHKAILPTAPKYSGYSPLHLAVEHKFVRLVRLLLARGADPDVRSKMPLSFTPLHLVTRSRSYLPSCQRRGEDETTIAKALIANGADINAKDNMGMTPLMHACNINYDQYEPLCEKFGPTGLVNGYDEEYFIRMVDVLLSHGANARLANNKGETALHLLASICKDSIFFYFVPFNFSRGINGIAELLLNDCDVNAQTNKLKTPLHDAIDKRHTYLVSVLLRHGADVTLKDSEGETALHVACGNPALQQDEFAQVARALILHGADINSRRYDGKTPLHRATLLSWRKLPFLLSDEFGIDVNSRDREGRTPLFEAIEDHRNISILLDHGADVNMVDRFDKTAIEYICYGHESRRYMVNSSSVKWKVKIHLTKLRAIGARVCCHNKIVSNDPEYEKMCKSEAEKLQKVKIDPFTSLRDILFKNINEMAVKSRNTNLQSILRSKNFETEYPMYSHWLKLRMQKALIRDRLMMDAKETFWMTEGKSLPDLCVERILQHLNNNELTNLIKATTLKC